MESTSKWLPMSERYMKVRTGRHWTPGDHISDSTCKKSRKKSSKLSFSGIKVLIKSHLLHIFWGFEECSKGTFLIFENVGLIYILKIWLENIRNSAKKIWCQGFDSSTLVFFLENIPQDLSKSICNTSIAFTNVKISSFEVMHHSFGNTSKEQ